MIVKRTGGLIYKINEVDMEDMEMIVCVSNMAGYLEEAKQIYVENDAQLAKFCVNIVEQYQKEVEAVNHSLSPLYQLKNCIKSFHEFATDEIYNHFAIEN